MATAWRLAEGGVREVHLADPLGVGRGASGVAGGLLHQLSPRGKPLVMGPEGVAAAEEALAAAAAATPPGAPPVYRRRGLERPARTPEQLLNFERYAGGAAEGGTLRIPEGVVVEPTPYLEALWAAAEAAAARRGNVARLERRAVHSLEAELGRFDAVAVCTGAASALLVPGLPLRLCAGRTLDLVASADDVRYPDDAPGLLGPTYVAPHGPRRLAVGATKEYGVAPESALRVGVVRGEEAAAVETELRAKGAELYAPVADPGAWRLDAVRYGVRALAPRTEHGQLPLLGRLDDGLWLFAGLGSRGLVFHALGAGLLADAVMADDPSLLPPEFTSWQQRAAAAVS